MAIPYNTNYDLTMAFVDASFLVSLAMTNDVSFTVPGTSNIRYSARFTYNDLANVFVGLNAAVTIPAAGNVGTQQYAEFKPGTDGSQRYVNGGDVLHFKTPDAAGAYIGVRLMQVPTP